MVYNGKSYAKLRIWGYPHFRKPPFECETLAISIVPQFHGVLLCPVPRAAEAGGQGTYRSSSVGCVFRVSFSNDSSLHFFCHKRVLLFRQYDLR